MSGSWTWRKSSASPENPSTCVEVACTGSMILIRDSKRRYGSVVGVTPAAWGSFLLSLSGGAEAAERTEPGHPRR
ncbi:hypothetical protein GCM10017779_41640 [Streptomyces capillispiralis]|nr:hypothetical protein GCM10017779_41640 [Streptomyces capillispiralis]